jgi:hypothetical protein
MLSTSTSSPKRNEELVLARQRRSHPRIAARRSWSHRVIVLETPRQEFGTEEQLHGVARGRLADPVPRDARVGHLEERTDFEIGCVEIVDDLDEHEAVVDRDGMDLVLLPRGEEGLRRRDIGTIARVCPDRRGAGGRRPRREPYPRRGTAIAGHAPRVRPRRRERRHFLPAVRVDKAAGTAHNRGTNERRQKSTNVVQRGNVGEQAR